MHCILTEYFFPALISSISCYSHFSEVRTGLHCRLFHTDDLTLSNAYRVFCSRHSGGCSEPEEHCISSHPGAELAQCNAQTRLT